MRRTWIEIGSGGVLYLVVTVLILFAALYTQANMLFWSFGLLVGGALVSAVMPWLMLRGLRVQRLLPGHGVVGQTLVIRYHIVNTRRFLPSFNLVIREAWPGGGPVARLLAGFRRRRPDASPGQPSQLKGRPHGWVLHLGPNQTIQAEAPCWPTRRGQLAFGTIELRTSFPFGVTSWVLRLRQDDHVLIYPRLYRLHRRVLLRLSAASPCAAQRMDKGGGVEEFFGLRPYRPGDSMKMIDWKHSARTGDLVARELTQPTPPRLMLLLDLTGSADAGGHRTATATPQSPVSARVRRWLRVLILGKIDDGAEDEPDRTDPAEQAISLAASLVCDAHFHGYQVGLAVRGADCQSFPVHHSLPHRTRLLEALAQIDVPDAAARPPAAIEPVSLPAEPSIVIVPGPPVLARGMGRVTVMATANMTQYVRDTEEDAAVILDRRTLTPSRRRQLREDVA